MESAPGLVGVCWDYAATIMGVEPRGSMPFFVELLNRILGLRDCRSERLNLVDQANTRRFGLRCDAERRRHSQTSLPIPGEPREFSVNHERCSLA